MLEGTRSNRMALGARLKIRRGDAAPAGGRFIRSSRAAAVSAIHRLQQETGLGDATAIEEIEVKWPATGETQVFPDVGMNQIVAIREGDSAIRPIRRAAFLLGGDMVH